MNNEFSHDENNTRHLHDKCKHYVNYHVMLTMNDGRSLDGIIVDVSADRITVLVGEDVMERESDEEGLQRYPRRYRRFNRLVLPLAALTALSLLPYAYPPPYPYPPYPYPYYPYY